MQEAGYTKDSAGFWSKNGTRLTTDLLTPGWLKPIGPVLEKQLRDNGFDATFKLFDPDTNPCFDIVRARKADLCVIAHCGTANHPSANLQHSHTKYNSP